MMPISDPLDGFLLSHPHTRDVFLFSVSSGPNGVKIVALPANGSFAIPMLAWVKHRHFRSVQFNDGDPNLTA